MRSRSLLVLCAFFLVTGLPPPVQAQTYYYVEPYPGEAASISPTNVTCDSTVIGAIRYNTGTAAFEDCNGTSWGRLATPASTSGSVQFNSGGAFGGSANFFWDNVNGRLGIGTGTPYAGLTLHVNGNVGATNYCDTTDANCFTALQVSTLLGGTSIGGLTDAYTDYATDHNLILSGNPTSSKPSLTAGAQYNVFIGESAGPTSANSVSGTSNNIALGYQALTGLTKGSGNTAIGPLALAANTSGGANVAVGYQALNSNVGAIGSTAIGYQAMYYIDAPAPGRLPPPANNTAVGYGALEGSTTPSNNIGTNNTALGAFALSGATSGQDNTVIGSSAGSAITTGAFNIVIGPGAGSAITTGGANIVIGNGVGTPPSITTFGLNIGNLIYGDMSANEFVGINQSAPGATLDVKGTLRLSGATSGYVGFAVPAAAGSATYTLPSAVPGTTGYVLSSDTSGNLSWVANGGGATLNGINAATGSQTGILNGANTIVWNWALAGTGSTAFTFGESAAATGGGKILNVATAAASTAVPLTITNAGASTIAMNITAGGVAFNGTNVLTYPHNSADTTSWADGPNTLTVETGNTEANTALGPNAGQYVSSGANNTALGALAMQGVSGAPLTGGSNTAVGYQALLLAQGAATENTAMGQAAGAAVTTGTDNTLLGWKAGFGVTGNSNIIVGEDPSTQEGHAARHLDKMFGEMTTEPGFVSAKVLESADRGSIAAFVDVRNGRGPPAPRAAPHGSRHARQPARNGERRPQALPRGRGLQGVAPAGPHIVSRTIETGAGEMGETRLVVDGLGFPESTR